MEQHGARQRITRRRYRGYGGGGVYGWMYGYGGYFGDREGEREDLTMTGNLGEQFDGIGDGGDGGGDGGGGDA